MFATIIASRLPAATPVQVARGGAGTPKTIAVNGPNQSAIVTVSSTATAASEMLQSANKFIQSEHIEPFTAFDAGNVTPGAYLNVEKYNAYVFDKAASDMITKAASAGLSLSKDDVLSTLKANNSSIASLKTDNETRVKALGDNNVFAYIGVSDLDILTSMYITGKEAGLDTSSFDGLAMKVGSSNKYRHDGTTMIVHDPERENAGLPYSDSEAKVSSDAKDEFDKIKLSLYDKLGLSTQMINLLVDSVRVGNKETTPILSFIQSILSIKSQEIGFKL